VSVYRKLAAAGVLVVGMTLPLGATASAQACTAGDDYCTPPNVDDNGAEVEPGDSEAPTGGPIDVEVPTGGPAQVETQPQPAAAPTGGLPLTGGDVLGMAGIGAGAVAIGTVLVRRSKRSSAAAA